MYVLGSEGLAGCRLLCLGYGVDWAIVLLLDLKNVNQQSWFGSKDNCKTISVVQSSELLAV